MAMKLTVSIIECKNLIVGDLISGLADPYVIATINAPAKEIRESEEKLFPSPSAIIRDHKSILAQPSVNLQITDSTNSSFTSQQPLVPNMVMTTTTRRVSSASTSPTVNTANVRGRLSIVSSKSYLNHNQSPSPTTNNAMNGSVVSSVNDSSSPSQINEMTNVTSTSTSSNLECDTTHRQEEENIGKTKSSSANTPYVNKAPCDFKNRKIIAQKKTEIIYNTLNPIFTNEFLTVDNIRDVLVIKNWLLTLEVYDYDYVKYDDYLGSVEISLDQVQVLEPMILTIPLEGVPHGEITIDINLGEESQIFGVDIEKVMSRHREKLHGKGLPKVVHDMFVFLSDDLSTVEEGIFRIPGKVDSVLALKKLYDKCEDREIRNFILEQEKIMLQDIEQKQRSSGMVKIVASLLKDYLRSLPVPLLTYALYDEFVNLSGDHDEAILETVQKLPPLNQHLLYWLLALIDLIIAKTQQNKMTASSLASVISLNVLKRKEDKANQSALNLESVRLETDKVIRSLEILITKYKTVLYPYFSKTFTFFK
ncbi:hypothetical protein C9374_003686 [Naegleria lovaniensis]|uniref:Rho GTPase activating protein n=1 Tax=Naegleria lovaniensis TaxID=51637 RepID=A0AA88KS92_NAELO|nr:uncharacterized protein C9374_003686 [Naegleria lovaniensis]KAG2393922.1 hypothetical protein C9374_003686 [Naegleria lovaniensis]